MSGNALCFRRKTSLAANHLRALLCADDPAPRAAELEAVRALLRSIRLSPDAPSIYREWNAYRHIGVLSPA